MGFSFFKKTVKDTPAEKSAVDVYASEFKHELVKLIVEHKKQELPAQNYELLKDSIFRNAQEIVKEEFNGYWRNSSIIEKAFEKMGNSAAGRATIISNDYVLPAILASYYHDSMKNQNG